MIYIRNKRGFRISNLVYIPPTYIKIAMNQRIAMQFLLGISILLVTIPIAYAEERECADKQVTETWKSEDHGDNKESEKEFEKSVSNDSLCITGKLHDHEEIKGEITDWTDFKQTENYQSATHEQKECLKEYFDLPDDGKPALQGYELEYCAWDED